MVKAEGMQSVNWNAPDPAVAERFYVEVLGGSVTARHQVGGVDVGRGRVGSPGLGLFAGSRAPASGVPHHTFRMTWEPDESAASTAIEATGVAVVNRRDHGDGPGFSLYVTDPIGNYLELSFDPPA